MGGFPGSPRLLRGGIVLIDPETGTVKRLIVLQYNPDNLKRTLEIKGVGTEGNYMEAHRLKGPPTEKIDIEAELDAVDQLDYPEMQNEITQYGILKQLASLETMIYPTGEMLRQADELAGRGSVEIIPMNVHLPLFIWGNKRILPVRITTFSVTEEAFDTNLNPIRAKVTLGMQVLTIDDLAFHSVGGSLFMQHLFQKENLVLRGAGLDLLLGRETL